MLIDDIVIDILIILFIYLVIFCICYAFYVFISTKKNQIGSEQKYLAQDLPGNLIVIVYADSADKSVLELAKALENQKYPKENYNVHIIFDNVNDEIVDEVNNIESLKVWRINKGAGMGKDEAISWLLEKLISFRNVNAFVFLDANRLVKENFLAEINKALFRGSVIVCAKEYIVENGDIFAAVKNQTLKYANRIFNTARAVLNFIVPVDSGAVAIKQEVLELVKCVDFADKKSEYMYTIFLASKGYFPFFAPDAVSKVKYENDKKLSLRDKMSILKYGLQNLLGSNFKLAEFLFSFFKPSAELIILLYLAFFAFLYNFEVKNMFFYDAKYIAFGAISTLIIFLISVVIALDSKIHPVILLLSPVYTILEKIFPTKKETVNKKQIKEDTDMRGVGQAVQVSDGKDILNCTIEIKNTGSGMQAIFRYKNKKLESSIFDSPNNAVKEISEKLNSNGLKLLVCSSCAHFGFKPGADITTQKGLCSCKEKMTEDIQPETSILNTCEYFNSLSDLNNVVDFPKEDNK